MKLPESTARDAMKAAKITDRSAAGINNLGLANSPSAYQAIAAERTTKAQIAKAREIANSKQEGTPALDGASVGPGTEALLTAWKEASQTERRHFLKLVGLSGGFDRTKPARSTGIVDKTTGAKRVVKGNRKPLSGKQLALNWPEPRPGTMKEEMR